MPRTYTVKQVADILGYSTNSIYTFLKEKRIKGVRVGKGRFRIPEEELQRILHLSRKPTGTAMAVSPAGIGELGIQGRTDRVDRVDRVGDASVVIASDALIQENDLSPIAAPNIFDWFVGSAAIVSGAALFLFNSVFSTEQTQNFARFLPAIRIMLIASGLGVLISGIFREGKYWHKIFHGLLSLLGFVNAYGLVRVGDFDGAVIYGGFAFVIGLTSFVPLGGVVSILIYATILAALIPFVMFVFPGDPHVRALAALIGLPSTTVAILSAVVASTVMVFFWVGYSQSRVLFLISAWVAALIDVLAAVWFAQTQYWSRAFFMIVVAYFTGFMPYWWPLQQYGLKRHKLMLHGLFFAVGCVLLMAVALVGLLQQSAWHAREQEFTSKLAVAETTLTNTFESVKSALVVAAANQQFVEVIKDNDIAQLSVFAKILYESNPNIRRLVFLDKEGDGIALYPYGTFVDPNFAYRDYFQKAKTTNEPFVSNLFQVRSDQSARYVVVVAIALRDAQGSFAGVMTASVDIDGLGLKLRQIANESNGELFLITDGNGTVLSYPKQEFVGTKAPEGHVAYRAISGETGIGRGLMLGGAYGMMAHRPVKGLGWALCLTAPDVSVFDATSPAVWSIFGVIGLLMLVSLRIFTFIQPRTIPAKEGSP